LATGRPVDRFVIVILDWSVHVLFFPSAQIAAARPRSRHAGRQTGKVGRGQSQPDFWPAIVKPGAFRLLSGETELTLYQFHTKTDRHFFCRHCGIRSFGTGRSPRWGEFYAVNVTCLDDVTEEELVNAPITYLDGKNDHWETPPAEVRHL